MNNHEHEDNSTSISSKLSGSKIWSFVSSILRFASLNSPNNLSMQEPSTTKDNESHAVIRRCASFAGMFRVCSIHISVNEIFAVPIKFLIFSPV